MLVVFSYEKIKKSDLELIEFGNKNLFKIKTILFLWNDFIYFYKFNI